MINDKDIPITNIIKRKNKILNNIIISIPTINNDSVNIIIKNNGDIHGDDEHALFQACTNGHLYIVKCLIKYGANIHAGLRACSDTT